MPPLRFACDVRSGHQVDSLSTHALILCSNNAGYPPFLRLFRNVPASVYPMLRRPRNVRKSGVSGEAASALTRSPIHL